MGYVPDSVRNKVMTAIKSSRSNYQEQLLTKVEDITGFQIIKRNRKRQIGRIYPHLVINEKTIDAVEITQHPVQQGASVSDHQYKKPVSFTTEIIMVGADQSDLEGQYAMFRDMQDAADLIDVSTLKRIYKNMVIKSISVTTDKESENILRMTLELQKVIIVNVATTTVPPRSQQRKPAKTGSTTPAGAKSAQTETSSKRQSAISILFGGIK